MIPSQSKHIPARSKRPHRHADACHLPRSGRGGFGFTAFSFPRPRRGKCRATRGERGACCSYAFLALENQYRSKCPHRHADACHLPRSGRGGFGFTAFSFPRPRRGKCRATRGDRGTCCSYAFLTIENRYRPRRPHRHAGACHLPGCGRGGFWVTAIGARFPPCDALSEP